MGAAEYEWGALPKCLGKMWDADLKMGVFEDLVVKVYVIYPTKVVRWKGCEFEEVKNFSVQAYTKDINTIYHKINSMGTPIDEICKGDHGSFRKAIIKRKVYNEERKTIGWLSLCNNYAWFLDKEVADKFAKLVNL